MKTIKLIALALLLASPALLPAQSRSSRALDAFLRSDYMRSLEQLRQQCIDETREFRRSEYRYPRDTARVHRAYNHLAQQFNTLLSARKADLLDPMLRRHILAGDTAIEARWNRDLAGLENECQAYKGLLNSAEGIYTASPAALLMLIPEAVKVATQALKLLREHRQEMRELDEKMLRERLVNPYALPAWQRLAAS